MFGVQLRLPSIPGARPPGARTHVDTKRQTREDGKEGGLPCLCLAPSSASPSVVSVVTPRDGILVAGLAPVSEASALTQPSSEDPLCRVTGAAADPRQELPRWPGERRHPLSQGRLAPGHAPLPHCRAAAPRPAGDPGCEVRLPSLTLPPRSLNPCQLLRRPVPGISSLLREAQAEKSR